MSPEATERAFQGWYVGRYGQAPHPGAAVGELRAAFLAGQHSVWEGIVSGGLHDAADQIEPSPGGLEKIVKRIEGEGEQQ